MHHRWRAAIGPLTLVPIAWTLVCAVRVVQWWSDPPFDMDEVLVTGEAVKMVTRSFTWLAIGTVAVAAVTVALVLALVLDASSSARVPEEQRPMWCLILILGLGFTMPLYWWLNLRDAPSARSTAEGGGRGVPLVR